MLILGIESTAKAASAALYRDGEQLGLSVLRCGLTHSRTLLPLTLSLLENAGLTIHDIDSLAVAAGPGSFTGVRIGVATVKGLCWGADKPAAGVSTLEAMAYGAPAPVGSVVAATMDARRNQLYAALFEITPSGPVRLCPDAPVAAADFAATAAALNKPLWLMGDGWACAAEAFDAANVSYTLAPEGVRYQNAWGVCLVAAQTPATPAEQLLPTYLRLSQAERERQQRMAAEQQQ